MEKQRRDEALRSLRGALTFDEHPDDLMQYVDRELPRERRREVAEHLAWCAQCREDVDDYGREREQMQPHRGVWIAAAAAAAVVIAVLASVFYPRREEARLKRDVAVPAPAIKSADAYGRADWSAAVRDALQSQGVARPEILSELRPASDKPRGTTSRSNGSLSPAGVVVDTTTPRFEWTPSPGARYIVSVAAGDREVANSGQLAQASWTPPHPLARGTTYTWQVEVRLGPSTTILPAPPRPPALFRIVDDATANELAEAARRFPADHLLLGVLYARAGVQSRAAEELAQAASPAAAKIAASIRNW
ncbi:MAG TPA: zf-HC2 domain-containing protein [Thermoanaerobaculia bacterium]|nr:zf-HC2 domain-containing protein [Thermoanaerobaculia bacterium]